jgi:hypothetical protein
MEFHEVANIFPLMNWRDYQMLKSDITENGLKEAIVVYKGKIIDGRHRYRACLELGIDPKLREWDERGSLVAFAISMNLHRRHLSTSQRAMVASDIKPLFEREARIRQGARTDLSAKLHESEKGKASEQAARLVNVSTRSVESANKVKRKGIQELVEAVKEGEVPVSTAAKVADLPPSEQLKIATIEDKREIREVAKNLSHLDRQRTKNNKDPLQERMDDVRSILRLLEKATELLIDRDASDLAAMFIQTLPVCEKELSKEVEKNIEGARLFYEIYHIWGAAARKGNIVPSVA